MFFFDRHKAFKLESLYVKLMICSCVLLSKAAGIQQVSVEVLCCRWSPVMVRGSGAAPPAGGRSRSRQQWTSSQQPLIDQVCPLVDKVQLSSNRLGIAVLQQIRYSCPPIDQVQLSCNRLCIAVLQQIRYSCHLIDYVQLSSNRLGTAVI